MLTNQFDCVSLCFMIKCFCKWSLVTVLIPELFLLILAHTDGSKFSRLWVSKVNSLHHHLHHRQTAAVLSPFYVKLSARFLPLGRLCDEEEDQQQRKKSRCEDVKHRETLQLLCFEAEMSQRVRVRLWQSHCHGNPWNITSTPSNKHVNRICSSSESVFTSAALHALFGRLCRRNKPLNILNRNP